MHESNGQSILQSLVDITIGVWTKCRMGQSADRTSRIHAGITSDVPNDATHPREQR